MNRVVVRTEGGHGNALKVYLYRTRPRLDGFREGMVEIKQTKVVYTERESEREARP